MAEVVAGTSAKIKSKPVKRNFKQEWEHLFFVTEHNNKTVCLLCRFEFTDNKKHNVERHFEGNHSQINVKFPSSSDKRSQEILRLKNSVAKEQKIVKKYFETNELVTCASYQIAFTLAKNGKAYSDGEMYKNLLQSTIETLSTNLDEKTKVHILNNVNYYKNGNVTIEQTNSKSSSKRHRNGD